ncbi:hypothetical protein JCM1840_003793 [Sporobolomyces johnsonii]
MFLRYAGRRVAAGPTLHSHKPQLASLGLHTTSTRSIAHPPHSGGRQLPPDDDDRPAPPPKPTVRPKWPNQFRPQQRTPPGPLSPSKVRTLMVDHLSHRQPRAALRLFLSSLSAPTPSATSRSAEGLAWLFFAYRQPGLAFEAIAAMHAKGYLISPRLASKLLRSYSNQLTLDPDALATVLSWISDNLVRGTRHEQKEINEGMLETVLEVLKRTGREDWSAQLFQAYRDTLEEGEVGNPRLWSLAIATSAKTGDVRTARALFDEWRVAYSSHREKMETSSPDEPSPPPPEGPYLALLNHFATRSPPLPVSRDPAYGFLQLVKADGLALSIALLNAFLRTELHRKRFVSFWGLWKLFSDPTSPTPPIDGRPLLQRNSSSWKLAVHAKLWSSTLPRRRGKLHNSPLHALSPLPYSEAHTPTSRSLFAQLLASRLSLTSHRPALRLPTTKPDPFASSHSSASADLLNSFLDLFIASSDFPAAAVVLETFAVHRVEPTASTHASVVLGVIKHGEKGRLPRKGKVEHEIFGLTGGDEIDSRERGTRTRMATGRAARIDGGVEAREMVARSLERRKMRVGLWTGGGPGGAGGAGGSAEAEAEGEAEKEKETEKETGEKEDVDEISNPGPRGPPEWMVKRELRETGYLVDLLRRCTGLDEEQWGEEMVATRKELLPPSRKGGRGASGKSIEEGGAGKKKRPITRASRFRHEAYGKPL